MLAMKKIILSFNILFTSMLSFGQVQYLTIEGNHSSIGFEIDIAGGATKVTGKFTEFDLEAEYKNKRWTESNFTFTIQVKSINTGIEDRDAHLRTADFFDVDTFPEIKFVSTKITKVDHQRYNAQGTFTMHGISKVMDLPFEITHEEKNTIGIKIETKVNRIEHEVAHEFKHSAIENFLSDNIAVKIYLWTKRDKRKE